MDVLVTEQVLHEITEATRRGRQQSLEFGGSLMAHERDGEILVVYAVPTGPCANQGPGHVRTDVDFQNAAIKCIWRRWPRLYYAGDWHVHPMWMPYLSHTDHRTARAILEEDGAHLNRLVLLLGTARPKGEPIVAGFVAELCSPLDFEPKKVNLRCVAGDSKEVLSHLGQPMEPLDEVLSDNLLHPEPSEHDGVERIERDLDELRRELNAEATLWTNDDLLGAVVQRGGDEAIVLFPPEYPFGAPQIFAGSLDEGPLRPIPLHYGWSSRHRLADPVGEALNNQVADQARCSPSAVGRRRWPFSRLWTLVMDGRSRRQGCDSPAPAMKSRGRLAL